VLACAFDSSASLSYAPAIHSIIDFSSGLRMDAASMRISGIMQQTHLGDSG